MRAFFVAVWVGLAGLIAVGGAARPAVAAEHKVTITNPLNLDWPAELIYLDIPEPNASGDWVAEFDGKTVPAQIEPGAAGEGKSRLWFVATIAQVKEKGTPPRTLEVTLKPGRADSPLKVTTAGDATVIENGVHALKLPAFAGDFSARPLSAMPPPVVGVRMANEAAFYGDAKFESELKVVKASTQVLQRGPVFVTYKISYQFDGQPKDDGKAPDPGEFNNDAARGVAFNPAGRGYFYEATVRVVANDPWAEVDEQYNLPEGVNYWLTFKDKQRFDTVMWVRWFGYEFFGGNNVLKFVAPEPQKMQRGPFVAMRPRWNQMPGGGQDFFLTRGGSPKSDKPEDDAKAFRPSPYDPQAGAVGIVAAYAGRWVNPYAQTISAFAENGDGARIRFPVNSGRRAYAIVVGERNRFDNTGRMNALVRRHTDWTLNKQIHGTTLVWQRDPAKAGPHILVAREDLERLRADYQANKDTPEMRIVRDWVDDDAALRAVVEEFNALDRKAKDRKLPQAERDAAAAEAKEKSKAANDAKKKLGEDDFLLLAAITGKPFVGNAPTPAPDQWFNTRYQDDSLNPTQGSVRRMAPNLTRADLAANGQPWGGPAQAAIAYIFADPDNWPGWMNGWTPGNPNFHTDKYSVVAYAAAALLDHPDSKKWLAWAKQQFDDDIGRVILPSGVGYECPGYSGYSLGLQLELARVFENTGFGNVVADDPRFGKTATWHRHLLTPLDQRLGFRHEAPIGDTHRWTSGLGLGFAKIAKAYREKDPKLAAELMAVHTMLQQQGALKKKESLIADLLEIDRTIKPAELASMDWGSHFFDGFGVVMRSRFGTPKETFVTLKAGKTRGHYHNDEMSWHFYGAGTPLSLDYNCSYHPRGDHAALHNTMTFGRTVEDFKHIGEDKEVLAMEEIGGVAKVLAFHNTPAADATVLEMSADRLTLRAVEPEDAKFQYNYPQRDAPVRITHRRFVTLVKHEAGSPLNDYLVVRDDTRSADAQQLNIHLLTRDLKREGNTFRGVGQFDADVTLFFAKLDEVQAETRHWYYFDEWMAGPGKYGDKDSDAHKAWRKQIADTEGKALIPPEGWADKWQVGEYQQWLRLHTKPGSSAVYVIYPRKKNEPEPKFEAIADGDGVRVTLNGVSEEVRVSTAGGVTLTRDGKQTPLIEAGKLPKLGDGEPLTAKVVDDASPAAQPK